MSAYHDLTTEEGFSAYLKSTGVNHSSIKLLEGGTANYVYRVALSAGESIIYKHAASYLHSNPAFSFDQIRMDYEAHILSMLPALLHPHNPVSSVHPVALHHYSRAEKILCVADGGSLHLKAAYTEPSLNIPRIGAELGTWLAALHKCTSHASLSLIPGSKDDLKANNATGVKIYRYAYTNLSTAVAQYRTPEPELRDQTHASPTRDVDLAREIDDEYGSRLEHDNECVCHGDFWPGNILLRSPLPRPSGADPTVSSEANADVELTVVDWELVRRGTSATDVAQFCAEAFLLDRFRGGRGLRAAFLNAYIGAKMDQEGEGEILGANWVRRVAVHWGVHVAFWPTRVEWTGSEGTRGLVDIGVNVLRAVQEGNMEELLAKDLFEGVDDRYRRKFLESQ